MRTHRLPSIAIALTAALVAVSCSSSPFERETTADSHDEATPESGEAAETANTEEPPSFDSVIDELFDRGFNGVVAVSDGGEVDLITFGNADREAGVEIGDNTVFDIGSITKQFTGAAILRLQMDGRLSVDDALSDYLDDLPADKADITLHELLTHTAGFPDAIGDDYEAIERDAYIERAAATPLNSAPGERFAYSNVGYSLLTAVIEVVTGDTYEAYLREVFFDPVGMNDTGYVDPDWSTRTVAVGYRGLEPLGTPHEQRWADDGPYWNLRGNGGILSTAEDMLRWHEALEGNDVLNDDAKALFYGQHVPEDESGQSFYGYGWAIFPLEDDTTLITHNGGNGVFFADFLRFPDEDLAIFIATNRAEAQFDTVASSIASSLVDVTVVGGGNSECLLANIDNFDSFDVVDALPDTPAADVATRWFAFMTDPDQALDEASVLALVDATVSPELAPGVPNDALAEAAIGLREEFAGFEIQDYAVVDPTSFSARLVDAQGTLLLMSATLSDEDPPRVTCLNVGD